MPRTPKLIRLCSLFLALPCLPAQNGPAVSPFDMVRFAGQEPQVQVGDTWYRLLKIQGVERETLLAAARRRYGPRRWAKRFCEDLPDCLGLVQARPQGAFVSLELQDLKTGKVVVKPRIEMTGAKRQAIWKAEPRPGKAQVKRLPIAALDAAARLPFASPRAREGLQQLISPAHLREDLQQLHWLLQNVHSYAGLRKFPYARALGVLQREHDAGMGLLDLHLNLRMLVARLGDGHARVRGIYPRLPSGYLPFYVRAHRQGVLVGDPGTGRLLDPAHPLLVALDGRPVKDWLAVAGRIEAVGSAAMERRRATRNLAFAAWIRHELGMRPDPSITLTLSDGAGKQVEVKAPLAPRPQTIPEPVRQVTQRDGLTYLRIPGMDSGKDFVAFLHQAMQKAKDSPGLVIDVRGNGGGSRVALQTLLPYFMPDDAAPFVANIACYRLPPGQDRDEPEGFLQNRALYPLTSERWDAADQQAIRAALRRFKPRWMPPAALVSAPHFMLVGPRRDAGQYYFDKRVALLIDGGCFSATDIFAGAFKDHGKVRLFGQPTSGGSGRSESYTLEHSGLQVRLSTMVSYRPSGQLYDGVGVAPHEEVWPALEDLRQGRDRVWLRASAWVRQK